MADYEGQEDLDLTDLVDEEEDELDIPDDPDDEDDWDAEGDAEEGEDGVTDDDIAAYLANRGYLVSVPGQGSVGAPQAPQPDGFDLQFEALKDEYGRRYAESLDDEERFEIQAEFQQAAMDLQLGQIEKQSARAVAAAAIPSVQAEFAANGLPPEAGAEYAMLLADLPPTMRVRTDAQIGALQMAIGRTAMRYIANPPGPRPNGVQVPRGEAPGSGLSAPDSGLTAKELSTLKSLFPKVRFTPAKIAELRKEGIL